MNERFMDNSIYIKDKISELLTIVNELEEKYPGRKFSLDGHLLGSIGEALASYYYGIILYPNSTKTHDGERDGKRIQIKITQGTSVDINDIPDYLIVLFLKKSEGKVYEVFNGPGSLVLSDAKRTKNGWYNRSLSKLSDYDQEVVEQRISTINHIDKWNKSIRN